MSGGHRAFTDALREAAEPAWRAAVGHRFVAELADDTLPDPVYAAYLSQDYAFIGSLVSLVGAGVAHAPDLPAKSRLSAFLGVLTGPENDYFERAFAALGVPLRDPDEIAAGPATAGLGALIRRVIATGDYGEILCVLTGAEWTYLAWAGEAAKKPAPSRFYLAEWIALHATPDFADFVDWLRAELDRAGARAGEAGRARLTATFRETIELEAAFFDQAYELAKS